MGKIVQFFQFLLAVITSVMEFLLSIPGMIASAFFSFVGIVASLASNVGDICLRVVEIFTSAQNALSPVLEFIKSNDYFGFFYHLIALDSFAQCLSTFVSIFVAVVILAVFEAFFQCIVVAVPFFIYKGVSKIVQATSAGFVKPA